MDAIYKFVLIGLAVASSALGQSNLTAPVTVFPPAATDPATIRLREQLANGTQYWVLAAPQAITTSFVTQFPGWNGEANGTDENSSFVNTRKIALYDRSGINTAWHEYSTTSLVGSAYWRIEDNASLPVIQFNRRVAGTPVDFADVYTDMRPNSDAGHVLGSQNFKWGPSFFTNLFTNSLCPTTISTTPGCSSAVGTDQLFMYGSLIPGTGPGVLDLGFSGANRWRKLWVTDIDASGTCTGTGCGSGTTLPVVDTTSITKGSADATKLLRFENDTNIPTGTTYTMIVPANPGTFAVTDATQTFTAAPTFAASLLVSGTRNSGTAAAPWNDTYSTTLYQQVGKFCNPGSTFGTCWTLQTSSSGANLDVLNTSGSLFARFDSSNSAVFPGSDNGVDLGLTGATQDWRSIYFATSLVQNGTTRIDSSGNITGVQINATTGFYVGGTQIFENTGPYWSYSAGLSPSTSGYTLGLSTKQWGNIRYNGSLILNGTTIIDNSANATFNSASITSNFSATVGPAGNFYNRTFSGTPSCSGVTDGWTGIDTSALKIWVCIGGTARYGQLI